MNGKKLTKNQAIEKIKAIHGDKYAFDKFEYKGAFKKIILICNNCCSDIKKDFNTFNKNYLHCDCLKKKEAQEKIINKMKKAHSEEFFDYSQFTYTKPHTPSKIICRQCNGELIRSYSNHIKSKGCHLCKDAWKKDINSIKVKFKELYKDRFDYSLFTEFQSINQEIEITDSITEEKFKRTIKDHYRSPYGKRKSKLYTDCLKEIKEKYGNKYAFPDIKNEYQGVDSKVTIICNDCKYETKKSICQIMRHGCAKCSGQVLTLEEIIKGFYQTHGYEKYDYSEISFSSVDKKVQIYCVDCKKPFNQTPYKHKKGQGCPTCKESWGERRVRVFLEKNNIKFERQKRFKDCRYKKPLPFDFYINHLNLCIEFDGEQHFGRITGIFTKEIVAMIQIRDSIKDKYCLNNNINLLRIPYYEIDNIEKILKEKLS